MNLKLTRIFIMDTGRLPENSQRALKRILKEICSAKSLYEIKNCSKLQGAKDLYRIRIGDYRITFSFDGNIVIMKRVLSRGEISKK